MLVVVGVDFAKKQSYARTFFTTPAVDPSKQALVDELSHIEATLQATYPAAPGQ